MMTMKQRRLISFFASLFLLSGCWVPQVIQGVQPQLFKTPPIPLAPSATVSLESRLVAVGGRMITVAKDMSALMRLSADLAQHRQVIENQNFYRIQAMDWGRWQFQDRAYFYLDAATGARYRLSMKNTAGNLGSADILGLASYGTSPLLSSFPKDVQAYQFEVNQNHAQGQVSVVLTGEWPSQIPLREAFVTTLKGEGKQADTSLMSDLTLQLDAKASSDASLLEGQLAFRVRLDDKVYNGFGRLDAKGWVGPVNITQNGVLVAQIVRQADRWDVLIDGRVLASGV